MEMMRIFCSFVFDVYGLHNGHLTISCLLQCNTLDVMLFAIALCVGANLGTRHNNWTSNRATTF